MSVEITKCPKCKNKFIYGVGDFYRQDKVDVKCPKCGHEYTIQSLTSKLIDKFINLFSNHD